MTTNKISNSELILKGFLWVNLPVFIIIITGWLTSITYFNVSNYASILIGGALGWIYWELTIKKWVKWALENNVEPARLLKVGQLSLLLWNSKQIDKVLEEKEQ